MIEQSHSIGHMQANNYFTNLLFVTLGNEVATFS